jgi:hypothetical protein
VRATGPWTRPIVLDSLPDHHRKIRGSQGPQLDR